MDAKSGRVSRSRNCAILFDEAMIAALASKNGWESAKANSYLLVIATLPTIIFAPLVGVLRAAERMWEDGSPERPLHEPTVAIRTGDTPSRERAAFLRRPSDILVTTPESLYLLLTSAARETLRSVRQVIVDEIHALVPTKRGAHLFLSLERLEELRRRRHPRP